jgi:hypothetical protein
LAPMNAAPLVISKRIEGAIMPGRPEPGRVL